MSSFARALSQIPALKRYIVENAGGYMFDLSGGVPSAATSLDANTILVDMGKTVFTDAGIFRKVMIHLLAGAYTTGYICLDNDNVVVGGSNYNQGVSRFN